MPEGVQPYVGTVPLASYEVRQIQTRIVKYLKQESTFQVWVLQGALFGLEPLAWKQARAVLRGARGLVTVLWGGNAPRLPD